MTPLQSATQAAESYLQSQRALDGLPAADILAERVIAAYEAARTADVSGLVERLADDDDLVDAFHAELRKQGAFSIEAHGKVGLAMYPFIKLVAEALSCFQPLAAPPAGSRGDVVEPALLEALDLIEDITARADAMKLGLVAYPVAEIKLVAAAIRNLGGRP